MQSAPVSTSSPIRSLISEVVDSLVSIFGDKVSAVYLAGSYAQGNARPESDVDFYLVLHDEPTAAELHEFSNAQEDLNARWSLSHVYRVDIDLIVLPYTRKAESIRRRTIVQCTGHLLYGQPLSGDVTAQFTPGEIAAAFLEWHREYTPTLAVQDPSPLIRTFTRRALAKYALRELEWMAVLHGAPISCTTGEFMGHIKQYIPEFTQDAEMYWNLYQKPYIIDSELELLQSKQASILRQVLRQVGN